MPETRRYAFYFVPTADSDLYRFGASVIGYDCHTGVEVPYFAQASEWPRPWADVARDPRQYGFHATLKAPFRLAPPFDEQQLFEALGAFASTPREIPIIDLVVRSMGSFVAFMPSRRSDALQRLAADCVETFDRFRAPLAVADRSRRIAAGLTDAQIKNLDRWGYPYVFDEFRFHMTLTGSLKGPDLGAVLALLEGAWLERGCAQPTVIESVTILRQDAAGTPFRTMSTWALRGQSI
jgi:putative phosphonate metabolism protein